MKIEIQKLDIGTKFIYADKLFVITSDNSYPFMQARCLTEPNEFEGKEVLFTDFEEVEVVD